jgi:hypothetical protein
MDHFVKREKLKLPRVFWGCASPDFSCERDFAASEFSSASSVRWSGIFYRFCFLWYLDPRCQKLPNARLSVPMSAPAVSFPLCLIPLYSLLRSLSNSFLVLFVSSILSVVWCSLFAVSSTARQPGEPRPLLLRVPTPPVLSAAAHFCRLPGAAPLTVVSTGGAARRGAMSKAQAPRRSRNSMGSLSWCLSSYLIAPCPVSVLLDVCYWLGWPVEQRELPSLGFESLQALSGCFDPFYSSIYASIIVACSSLWNRVCRPIGACVCFVHLHIIFHNSSKFVVHKTTK